jgi:dipeptidyl aminopeptidase/acylaminoacyl peptidase
MTDAPTPPATIAPFGSWVSPISAELIAGATIRLGQIAIAGDDILWSEGRPQEQGRNVIVRRRPDGSSADQNPAPYNVRTLVHEYGGGAFLVDAETLFFSDYDDQRVYRIDAAGSVGALTHGTDLRYADAALDARRQRLIAVREDHRGAEVATTLVAIDLANGTEQVLASGQDFYSNPRPSPDGRQLAWLSWNHPAMPWDATTLWLADLSADGSLGPARAVAGGERESIFQPSWSPRGELHFASDRSGWWNLYRHRDGQVQALHPMAAEFGEPQWAFGMSRYGFDAAGRIVCTGLADGDSFLLRLDPDAGTAERMATPYRVIHELRVGADFAVINGATATEPDAIVRIDLVTLEHAVLRRSSEAAVDPGFASAAEAIHFPTEGGQHAHAFFYAPRNRDFRGPVGEKPPLIVMDHGGPTGATTAGFKWSIQYWTSRGFAVVDVNYGGSHGFGRAYRQRLAGRWGVVDVDDSINAAKYLVARGDVSADRTAIRGGSAGGYTTLCALTFRSFFKAGASHYGVGDLEALARDTHKFESRYLDGLIGPYPQARETYRARSPVNHTDRLSSALILFQGAQDKAVPPSQAEAMFAAVRTKGLPVAYLLFEHEQHGFRRAETIRRVFEAELYFYGRVFGFVPAGTIEPVSILNLPAAG